MKLIILLLTLLFFTGFRENERFKFPLSKEDEKKYINDYYNLKDKKAREVLIERNLRLVANIAKKYVNSKNDLDDLISIGTIGLIKGIDTFKNENENKLSTYISKCIENEILMHFRKEKCTNEEIYLDDVKSNDKDGNVVRFIDTIEADETSIEEKVSDDLYLEKIDEIFHKVLSETEQIILKKRFGIYGFQKETQEKIAQEMGISRSYVSRIEKIALNKLNKKMKSKFWKT